MLEANPSLQPAEIKDILSRTATPLPRYFAHETGAGMLNAHAAVLESAFPARQMGGFRSTLTGNPVQFTTTTPQTFTEMVFPGIIRSVNIHIPTNVVQASVGVSWGMSTNDFGLKLYNANNSLIGESNYLNLPGLTGRREEIVLRNPASQLLRSSTQHTAGLGVAQNIYGTVELTRVEYPGLADLGTLSPENLAEAEKSMLSNIMLPQGKWFRPSWPVSRYDMAAVFVRAGLVSQYMAASPQYTDVKDIATRNAIESVQSNTNGKLFFDVTTGGKFYPNNSALRLAAAVAFVRAANLESETASTPLPLMADVASIPTQWRGYVAVALQHGFMSLDGNRFNPNRAVTRLELAHAINAIMY
jgi:serine protease AprX